MVVDHLEFTPSKQPALDTPPGRYPRDYPFVHLSPSSRFMRHSHEDFKKSTKKTSMSRNDDSLVSLPVVALSPFPALGSRLSDD